MTVIWIVVETFGSDATHGVMEVALEAVGVTETIGLEAPAATEVFVCNQLKNVFLFCKLKFYCNTFKVAVVVTTATGTGKVATRTGEVVRVVALAGMEAPLDTDLVQVIISFILTSIYFKHMLFPIRWWWILERRL